MDQSNDEFNCMNNIKYILKSTNDLYNSINYKAQILVPYMYNKIINQKLDIKNNLSKYYYQLCGINIKLKKD